MDSRQYMDLMEAYAEVYAPQEEINEADSLAAMQARREKRLKAQRKREGTTSTGRDFGHDYSLTPAQQKARRDAEFKAGTKNEEFDLFDEILEFLYVEGYVDTLEEAEWMMANLIDEEAIDIILGEDSRRMSNKQHTARVRSNIKSFGSNYTPPSNFDPDANRGQGEVLTRKQIEKKRRKSLRQEEFEIWVNSLVEEGYDLSDYTWDEMYEFYLDEELTGERLKRAETKIKSLGRRKSTADNRSALFKVAYGKEGTGLPGKDGQSGGRKAPVNRGGGGTAGQTKVSGSGGDHMDRGYGNKAARRAANEEFEAWLDEAMSNYEKNRKRAAQRAAARNAARDQGKTGVVPGVGYVTPRRERETWTDESGKTRHAKGL